VEGILKYVKVYDWVKPHTEIYKIYRNQMNITPHVYNSSQLPMYYWDFRNAVPSGPYQWNTNDDENVIKANDWWAPVLWLDASTVAAGGHQFIDKSSASKQINTHPGSGALPSLWFCVVRHPDEVLLKTFSLTLAQAALNVGSSSNQQAIIPMYGIEITVGAEGAEESSLGGDPQDLSKTWTGGSMWWEGWDEIHDMRAVAADEDPPPTPELTPYMEDNIMIYTIPDDGTTTERGAHVNNQYHSWGNITNIRTVFWVMYRNNGIVGGDSFLLGGGNNNKPPIEDGQPNK